MLLVLMYRLISQDSRVVIGFGINLIFFIHCALILCSFETIDGVDREIVLEIVLIHSAVQFPM